MQSADECRTARLVPPTALGIGPARPDRPSARRDVDIDDRAILDDDGADEEAAPGDGVYLAGTIPTAGSSRLSSHLDAKFVARIGGHARRLPDLCRYRC